MATPINGQNSERFESIPNQVHTIFRWELKIIGIGYGFGRGIFGFRRGTFA